MGGGFIFKKVEYIRVPKKIEEEFTVNKFDKVKEEIAKKMSKALDEQCEEVLRKIYSIEKEKPMSIADILGVLNKLIDDKNSLNKNDISSLKKRIKYCKNPMERIKLQRELNVLYKNKRRKG